MLLDVVGSYSALTGLDFLQNCCRPLPAPVRPWHPWPILTWCHIHAFNSRPSAPAFSQRFVLPRRSSDPSLCGTPLWTVSSSRHRARPSPPWQPHCAARLAQSVCCQEIQTPCVTCTTRPGGPPGSPPLSTHPSVVQKPASRAEMYTQDQRAPTAMVGPARTKAGNKPDAATTATPLRPPPSVNQLRVPVQVVAPRLVAPARGEAACHDL